VRGHLALRHRANRPLQSPFWRALESPDNREGVSAKQIYVCFSVIEPTSVFRVRVAYGGLPALPCNFECDFFEWPFIGKLQRIEPTSVLASTSNEASSGKTTLMLPAFERIL